MVSLRSVKPICVPPRLSEVSPTLQLNCSNVRLIDDGPFSSFRGTLSSDSSFHASLLQVIDCVMSFGFVSTGSDWSSWNKSELQRRKPLVVVGFPASLSARFESSMLRTVHPHDSLQVDVEHRTTTCISHSTFPFFYSRLIESVRLMVCVVWLSPLEAVQRNAASTSIVKLEVETVIIDCTVFMHDARVLLDSEAPTGLWWLSQGLGWAFIIK